MRDGHGIGLFQESSRLPLADWVIGRGSVIAALK